jgi:hypothetical protein
MLIAAKTSITSVDDSGTAALGVVLELLPAVRPKWVRHKSYFGCVRVGIRTPENVVGRIDDAVVVATQALHDPK